MMDYVLKKILADTVHEIGQHQQNSGDCLPIDAFVRVLNQIDDRFSEKYYKDVLEIIFESLYTRFKDCYKQNHELFFQSEIGKILNHNRKQLWSDSYGVPPLLFILKFESLIKEISELLDENNFESVFYQAITEQCLASLDLEKRWEASLVEPCEHSGFIATHNHQGYMTTSLDCFSQNFTCCGSGLKQPARLLEIGAAYGVASLAALKHGSIVVANDLDPIHLAIMASKVDSEHKQNLETVTGVFPEELEFPENYFDGALVCRVMHFFNAQRIIDSLKFLRKVIKPCGKIYIVNETPYLANWSSFIPEYETRKSKGIKWPGVIDDPAQYCPSRAGQLPSLVHWLDHETLLQALLEAGFCEDEVEEIQYINRAGQFPQDMLIPGLGKESLGCCVTKIN